MGFYEQISKYYDYIFPAGDQQLDFIKQAAGPAPKRLLDVACGSGGYSAALAKSGYPVTAIDLDGKMVEMARDKAREENLDIEVRRCDMKDIAQTFNCSFDCIFCIGNSIVHLNNMEQMRDVLAQMHARLIDGGVLVLQIINYDRILKYNISGLPSIKNEAAGVEFTRNYRYDKQKNLVYFDTVLTVEGGDGKETFDNTVALLPVMGGEMRQMLEEAGFKEIWFYGNFEFSEYDENAFMLVVKALP